MLRQSGSRVLFALDGNVMVLLPTLQTLVKAAGAVGKRVKISLVNA